MPAESTFYDLKALCSGPALDILEYVEELYPRQFAKIVEQFWVEAADAVGLTEHRYRDTLRQKLEDVALEPPGKEADADRVAHMTGTMKSASGTTTPIAKCGRNFVPRPAPKAKPPRPAELVKQEKSTAEGEIRVHGRWPWCQCRWTSTA